MVVKTQSGDPFDSCASFARFLLPFSYAVEPAANTADAFPVAHWEAAGPQDWLHNPNQDCRDSKQFLDLARCRYLTEETELVLFRRARWFILRESPRQGPTGTCPEVWKQMSLPKRDGNGQFLVAMRYPALVCFEWSDATPAGVEADQPDLLQSGFLILEAFFPAADAAYAAAPEDILAFNDLFRHWRRPFLGHDQRDDQDGDTEEKDYLLNLMRAIASQWQPDSESSEVGGSADLEEYRLYMSRWLPLLALPLRASGWFFLTPQGSLGGTNGVRAKWSIDSDSRTLVVACLVPPAPVVAPVYSWSRRSEPPDDIGILVKLLNVDPPGGPAHRTSATCFEREWLDERVYKRWLHFGCAYGFTDHSMAMLSSPCNEPPTWRHFGQMYFDQFLLLAYVRICLFRFSQALSKVSKSGRDAERNGRAVSMSLTREHFQELRKTFAWFTNLYRFPLVSTQQQSLEMYAMMSRHLDISVLYEEVESEVGGTHELLELLAAQTFNKAAMVLALLGLAGLLATAVQAIAAVYQLLIGTSPALTWVEQLTFWMLVGVVGGVIVVVWRRAGAIAEWMLSALTRGLRGGR